MIQASTEEEFVEEHRQAPWRLDDGRFDDRGFRLAVMDLVEADIARLQSEFRDLEREYEHCLRAASLRNTTTLGHEPEGPSRNTEMPIAPVVHVPRLRTTAEFDALQLLRAVWTLAGSPSLASTADCMEAVLRGVWHATSEPLLSLRRCVWKMRGMIEVHSADRLHDSQSIGEQEALVLAQGLGHTSLDDLWWARPNRSIVCVLRGAPDHNPALGNELRPYTHAGWQILHVSPDDFQRLRKGELEVPDDFGVNWQRIY